MNENEAKDIVRAKLKCMELELLACIEKGCDRKCDDCDYNYAQGNMGEQKEALSVAIQALEKQIPKKPIPIDYEKYMNTVKNALFLKGAYWCPNCKHAVKCGTYCSDCGQKLDWSDTE